MAALKLAVASIADDVSAVRVFAQMTYDEPAAFCVFEFVVPFDPIMVERYQNAVATDDMEAMHAVIAGFVQAYNEELTKQFPIRTRDDGIAMAGSIRECLAHAARDAFMLLISGIRTSVPPFRVTSVPPFRVVQ